MGAKDKAIERLSAELKRLRSRVGELEASKDERLRADSAILSALEELERKAAGLALANELLQREISERKLAEEAHRLAHHRLQGIVESLPDATFVVDQEGKVIAWNRAMEELSGLKAEEILGKGDRAYAIPFYGESRKILVDLVCSHDQHVPAHYDFVRKVGDTLYAEAYVPAAYAGKGAYLWMTASPLFDRSGKPIGAIESIRDISEYKRAEEALQAEHHKLLDIIDFLPDATFVIDRDRKVIAWNRAIEEMTGVPKEEMLGKGDYAYAVPFYGVRRPILIDQVFEGEVDVRSRYDYVMQKGSSLYAEAFVPMVYGGQGAYLWIIASPLYDRKGEHIGAIESIRDVSEHKKMAETLRENAEKIKHFAYSVSHDLKSPIVGINGLIRLLHQQYRDRLDERGRRYCDQVLKVSEHILALIEEINVFIKTKEIPLDFEWIQPKELIRMIRDEFGAPLSVRKIKWVEPDDIPAIRADRLSMLRVMRNLVENAIKYGGKDLSEIRIGYEQTEQFHIFTVSDDGVGINTCDREKLFRVFERNETSRGIEGTGLGLAIVREIAERHLGKVWVESVERKGTTFYVYIAKDL